MAKSFQLRVLTPEGPVFTGEAIAVQLPGTDGLFQVLAGHAALIAALAPGKVRIDGAEPQPLVFSIGEGLVEVLNDEVVVLSELVTAG